jgi:hypothetical protein
VDLDLPNLRNKNSKSGTDLPSIANLSYFADRCKAKSSLPDENGAKTWAQGRKEALAGALFLGGRRNEMKPAPKRTLDSLWSLWLEVPLTKF